MHKPNLGSLFRFLTPALLLWLATSLGGCIADGALSAASTPASAAPAASDVRNPEPRRYSMPWATVIVGTYFPRETVSYAEKHAPGTIVISTSQRRLYYVLGDGKALRYAIGVGAEGYAWSGTSAVASKREWPDWSPTPEMRKRKPELPAHMAGGKDNPLGARALYLGATLYRIHGTNEPWLMGTANSAGCIRMTNDDVIDLYNRTRIGATVIVRR